MSERVPELSQGTRALDFGFLSGGALVVGCAFQAGVPTVLAILPAVAALAAAAYWTVGLWRAVRALLADPGDVAGGCALVVLGAVAALPVSAVSQSGAAAVVLVPTALAGLLALRYGPRL